MHRLIAIVLGAAVISSPVLAGDDEPPEPCFASVGCLYDRTLSAGELNGLSCDELWTIRNGLFASRGYCFRAERGQRVFGNGTCSVSDQDQVPLSDYDRANIRLVSEAEKRRGC